MHFVSLLDSLVAGIRRDDQRTKRQWEWLGWSVKSPAELGCVVILQHPWDQRMPLDPAMITEEFNAKR